MTRTEATIAFWERAREVEARTRRLRMMLEEGRLEEIAAEMEDGGTRDIRELLTLAMIAEGEEPRS